MITHILYSIVYYQINSIAKKMIAQTFKGIKCSQMKPIHKVCLSQTCKNTPFLCQQSVYCACSSNHSQKCHIKDIQNLDESIKTILKFQFFIVYSPVYKGESIYVAGRYAVQTRPPVINQRIVLTYEPLPLDACETITFRMSRIKGCVGVGVFLRQVIASNDYKYVPDHSFLNHGCYMFLSNNLLYSHSRQSQNAKSASKFNINPSDIIKVKYHNQKVTFINRFLDQTIHVDVRHDQHLHFGVYLYDVEDQVQIVNTFVSGDK